MKDRSLTILISAIVIIVVGVLVYRAYLMPAPLPEGTVTTEVLPYEEARETSAWAVISECRRSGGRTVATGIVENTGNVDLNYVTVKVMWINRAGLIVEENEMYALNNEKLAPGETKQFTDVTERTTVVQCNVEPVDYW